ncbi:glycosyltransferase family 2 protein [Planctomonas sp. JC2975]|uniref:glycosyltransferase family 2 protein n=1 Tax=Planctomonas sp. JC2975 TaxID=2729626 RepID=UPI001472724F|nr:glycosyltransferase family A protein [Planctomonas sp. JC2975]NNC11434.1 glycosyltransferase family 2 protein [Planctomonas sp. JC2975]
MPTVSVVIPSLNDACMLRQCLADLAVQTVQPDEIVVVDNGSTDDTSSVAHAAGARVIHEPTRGVLHATAAGFDAAGYEIIGRLDADSRPAPDWIERIHERFANDPTLSAVTGTGTFYGCGPVWRAIGKYLFLGGYFVFIGSLVGHTPLFGSNFAIRRDAWLAARDRIHLDDPKAHDDLDLSFALDEGAAVEFDRRLRVRVSARVFLSAPDFLRKAEWAFHGVGVNWAEVSWPRRVLRSARVRAARRRARPFNGECSPESRL